MNPIVANAYALLKVMINAPKQEWVTKGAVGLVGMRNRRLQELTGLSAEEINDSVAWLEKQGAVNVLARNMGDNPFDFRWVQRVTPEGKYLYHELGKEIEERESGRFIAASGTTPYAASDGKEREYDVALSFAGEDRPFVRPVADILKKSGLHIFYDEDQQVNLWGKDLGDFLDDVYRVRSKYVVMFISTHYANKMWTNHERKSALSRAILEKREYVLPARFDDTELPGLRPTIAYIDLRGETPDSFSGKIIKKVTQY